MTKLSQGNLDGIKTQLIMCIEQAYERGFKEGQKSYGDEIRTKQDVEEAYKMGMERAWDTARRIILLPDAGGYKASELIAIFDNTTMDIFAGMEAWEAIEKEEHYTRTKDDAVHAGDVVLLDGIKGVVMKVDEDIACVIHKNGLTNIGTSKVEKTGEYCKYSEETVAALMEGEENDADRTNRRTDPRKL
jgi:hypothetical protein